MKALISLALLIGGVYLVVSSAAGVLTSASQDDTWWYIAWFAGGALCCFLAIPAGLAAGATGNRYRLQYPQERAYGSAEYHDIESTHVTHQATRPARVAWEEYEEQRRDDFQRLGIPEPGPLITVAEARTMQDEAPAPKIEAPAPVRSRDPYGYGGLLDLPHRDDE